MSGAAKKAAVIIRKAAVEVEMVAAGVQDRADQMPAETEAQQVKADEVQELADTIVDAVGVMLEEADYLESFP